ncbi:hypothetical protein [Vagococcus fluvialis]|uniref:hypothetical protein n=1 Tax=Vagococcus fluvialis TaxID=2738 RepID=UPI0037B0B077
MNWNLFKISLRKNTMSNKTLFLIVFSFLLAIIQLNTENNWSTLNEYSALIHLIGIDSSGEGTFIFVFSLPFICAFYGSSILADDKRNNLYDFISSRVTHKDYIKTYSILSALLGGIAAIIPFLIQSWICFMLYPMIPIDKYSLSYPLFGNLFGLENLLAKAPISFWLFCLIFYFVLGALYSLIGYVFSFYNKKNYLETIVPFIIMILTWLVSSLIGYEQFSPVIWSSFGHSSMFSNKLTIHPQVFMIIESMTVLFLSVILIFKERSNDDI